MLGTGRLAKPALHAEAFSEAQHRAVGIVRERSCWAGGDAGMTERAAIDIQVDATEWRSRLQRHDTDGYGSCKVEFAKRSLKHATFRAAGNKSGWFLRPDACRRRIEQDPQLVRIVGLDNTRDAFAKAKRGNN